MSEADDDMARVARVLQRSSSRSPLYQWMRRRHTKLADQLDGARPNWDALAAEFAAMGLTDSTGKPATGERARKTWWQVRHDLAAAETRREAALQARAAKLAAVPVSPVVPAPPAAPQQDVAVPPAPSAPAVPRRTFDPTEGAFDAPIKPRFRPATPR